jgi:hypothetical protein
MEKTQKKKLVPSKDYEYPPIHEKIIVSESKVHIFTGLIGT